MIANSGKSILFRRIYLEVRRKIAQDGVLSAVRAAVNQACRKSLRVLGLHKDRPHPFDLRYGTDTGGLIDPASLDIPDEKVTHATRYQTAIVDVFAALLDELPIDPREYTFIDLGSGKGRALLLASQLPFREIIGVEFARQLHDIACRNIKIYNDSGQKCCRVSSLCADASEFKFPPENLVIYMFNPFDEYVMTSVVHNLELFLKANQVKVYVIYLKPVHRRLFDKSDMFDSLPSAPNVAIYKTRTR